MVKHLRVLLLPFVACLIPTYAAAMTVEGGVIFGLEPDTVVELDLGLAEPSTARTDSNGEVVISDEEDDNPNTLWVPTGSNGRFDLTNQDSGEVLGALAVDGASITVATALSTSAQPYLELGAGRVTIDWGLAFALFDDLESSVDNGAGLAAADGLSVKTDVDDDTWGGSIGFGYAFGDGNRWGSKGSQQIRLRAGYTWYDEFNGSFTATGPGVRFDSSGKQEVDAYELSVVYRYHIADGLGLNAGLGYSWYDYEDSGRLVEQVSNTNLNAFSESNNEEIAKLIFGFSQDLTDVAGVFVEYHYDFDDSGVNEEERLHSIRAGIIYSF